MGFTLLSNQRALFDIPSDIAYFNCAYMSPLLRCAVAAGLRGMQTKSQPWSITPSDFFSDGERIRAAAAAVFQARGDDVALVPSASYGLAIAARNLALTAGQEILVLAEQFPSNIYVWRELAARSGASIHTVPRPTDNNWTDAVLERIGPQTAIAALPHCHWTDGTLVDLEAIGPILRNHGATLVVDLTQSLGALPFDCREIRPDFAVAACYKWLLGPYSTGVLYVAPQHQDGAPLEHNWMGRAGAQNFTRLIDYQDKFQHGARRFDVGETANFALLPALASALEQILTWGVVNIQETLRLMTGDIAERAHGLGLQVSDPAYRSGHFLGLRFPAGLPDGLATRLAKQHVYVSVRGDSVRVTPHLYNTTDDIDRLFKHLGKVI